MKKEENGILTKIGCIVVVVYLCITCYHQCSSSPMHQESKELTKEQIVALNDSCYDVCFYDILAAVALVENFHATPYHCGAKWTIGYGSTVLSDGTPVTENTPRINKDDAKEIVYNYLNKHVKPFILKYVYRPLNSNEMISTCLFIYNIGGANFSGFDGDGNERGLPSNFLCAINENLPPEECAKRLTGFRSSNGKQANGLLKRRWIEGAIFLGIITPEMLLSLEPAHFYQDSLMFYYKEESMEEYWNFDYSEETIDKFFEKNISSTDNVLSIL